MADRGRNDVGGQFAGEDFNSHFEAEIARPWRSGACLRSGGAPRPEAGTRTNGRKSSDSVPIQEKSHFSLDRLYVRAAIFSTDMQIKILRSVCRVFDAGTNKLSQMS